MDFQSMKRRELQALCKMNNIPANLTNAAMADALSSLPSVEGLDEYLGQSGLKVDGSPERSVITSPDVPRTTATRQRVNREDVEGATRTRCGTRRRAVEGTDTKKTTATRTTATRTTRKKASEEASAQKQMQEAFEADMAQSDVSENSALIGGGLKEISEEGSSVESHNEPQSEPHAVVSDEQEAIDESANNDNLEKDDAVSVNHESPTESRKVDFHSLGRKDLQSLCKMNKIPANTTNAAMANALTSLEIVEGLDDFVQECSTQAPGSPNMSDMTSSCARRTWTTRRATKEPTSSMMITKSCRGARRKVIAEEIKQAQSTDSETPAAPTTQQKVAEADTGISKIDSAQKRVLQTNSRRGTNRSATNKTDEVSTVKESAAKHSISVMDVEKDLQGQLEETHLEKPGVLDCTSGDIAGLTQEAPGEMESGESLESLDSDNKGDNRTVNSDIAEQVEGSLNEKDASTEVSDVLEQQEGLVESEDSEVPESESFSVNALMGKLASTDSVGVETDEPIDGDTSVEAEITPPKEAVSPDFPESNMVEDSNDDTCSDGSESDETNDDDVSVEGSESVEGLEDEEEFSEEDFESESETTPSEGIILTDFAVHKVAENVDNESASDGSEDEEEFSEEDSESESETTFSEGIILADLAQRKVAENLGNDSCSDDLCLAAELDDDHEEIQMSVETQAKNILESESDNQFKELVTSDSVTQLADDTLKKLGVEPAIHVNQVPSLVDNTVNSQRMKMVTFSDPAPDSVLIEKVESSHTEDKLSFAESTIQADPQEQETPLHNKSLRKLKRMIREKLQAAVLEKKMEKLTLDEKDIPVADVGESSEHHDVSAVIFGDAANANDEEDLEDVGEDMSGCSEALCPVNVLVDNELVSESSVTGVINVEYDEGPVEEKPSAVTPAKSSSTIKPLLSTPSKSGIKTPMSLGSRKSALVINKENIDLSECKTEPGSIKSAVTASGKLLSAMSMGKLKKEFKTLQQHSEKKRQVLQARSDNCCPLASP